ncbi:PrgI family protein [Carboxydothermus ferrireducens]|uniref:PrgI family protein n=1 Tax=Carboxydothermus ferrireducens DSM 11255 TaxID=1119529 RepID=A0ABX2R9A4_9THEO|nr:PrgI family protein [Carboxydothermus ferrireducens]NYE57127.1 hypothetical protein [Carboxydothermus ferrireducens DSM 11255]
MRMYPVPFSTREEERFLGLTLREAAWAFGGLIVGLFFSVLLSFLLRKPPGMMLLLAVPFGGAGFLISRWPVNETDSRTTLDRHIMKGLKYLTKTHDFIYTRK